MAKLITIPEYYQKYIDPKVDLNLSPKQCCPFHKESTPSFSFDARTHKWSCFGKCHAIGKDVIDMHQRRMKYSSREEAAASLGISLEQKGKAAIDLSEAYADEIRAQRVLKSLDASTPEEWLELDYEMSFMV